jgi:hypothetical protein
MRRVGGIDISIPLEEVRYVRRPNWADKSPTLDVITTDSNLTLKFESWAKRDDHRADTERFSELVASFMQLPESEVPTVNIDQEHLAIDPPTGQQVLFEG